MFKNKYDLNDYLKKFKVRICVREDLQHTDDNTYAVTLIARTFRALLTITAAFNLKIRQYNAVNAFINININDEIYCSVFNSFKRLKHC
jgi:hypothetical protein